MEADERGKSRVLAPACTIPVNQTVIALHFNFFNDFFIITNLMKSKLLKNRKQKCVIPLNCEATHSLLEEEPDSSDPEARSV